MFIKRIIRYLKWWIRWTVADAWDVLIYLFASALFIFSVLYISILPPEWVPYFRFLYDLIMLLIRIHLPICFYSLRISYKYSREPNFFKWFMALYLDMQAVIISFIFIFYFAYKPYILFIIDIIYYYIF